MFAPFLLVAVIASTVQGKSAETDDFPVLPDGLPVMPRFDESSFPTLSQNFTFQPRRVSLGGCPSPEEPVLLSPGETVKWVVSKVERQDKFCGYKFKTGTASPLSIECTKFNVPGRQKLIIERVASGKQKVYSNKLNTLETYSTNENEIIVSIKKISKRTKLTCTITAEKIDPPPSCDCGEMNIGTRIVGGEETGMNEYPYQAALVVGQQVVCGGTLIDSKWLVTAAHCTEWLQDVYPDFKVLVGGHSQTPVNEGLLVEPKQVIPHPEFNKRSLDSDIALIEIDPLDLSLPQYGTVCLPESGENFEGREVTVTGWGASEYEGDKTAVLNAVSLTTLDDSVCRHVYDNLFSKNMVCAFAEGKDACQGDSGGPMVTIDEGTATLVGLVSWGYECSTFPGVYTSVSRFVKWIEKTAEGFPSC